jgi:hypothetical protein
VEKVNIIPGAKFKATGFRPKNKHPSSTIAHVIRAHTSLVYAFWIVKRDLGCGIFLSALCSSRSDRRRLSTIGHSTSQCLI